MYRTCRKCNIEKSTTDFGKDSPLRGGKIYPSYICKKCHQNYVVERRAKKRLIGNCTRCASGRAVDGGNFCKKCRSKNRQHYYDNREKVLAYQRENGPKRTLKLRAEVFAAYGSICACCKEAEIRFLSIDHINGGGNQHRRELGIAGGLAMYRWLRKNGYPEGFQVLCMNCQSAKAWFGKCPHEDRCTKNN